MHGNKQKYSLRIVIALMLLASALTLALMTLISSPTFGSNSRTARLREYAELLTRLEENFIGEFDEQAVTTLSMRAAVAALEDEWSFYMTAAELAYSLNSAHNRYDGIGVTVYLENHEEGYIRVIDIVEGSSAQTAGIVPGDIILSVDEHTAVGITILDLRDLLRRPHGETAELLIRREDGTIETVFVEFGAVFIAPISYEMLYDNIGYIRLYNFNQGSANSFINAANYLIEAGAAGFVFDMRSNPGGWVTEMSEILDFLLPEGEIFIQVDRSGREIVTRSNSYYIDLPMVVIVNSRSFSGAEYFAAILREFEFAEIVGEQTTGKSRVQRIVTLQSGSAINISFAEYLTKNRVSLHDEGGVTPDHIVVLSDEQRVLFTRGELELADDPQLAKAIDVLVLG